MEIAAFAGLPSSGKSWLRALGGLRDALRISHAHARADARRRPEMRIWISALTCGVLSLGV